jgi:hypothetical protein
MTLIDEEDFLKACRLLVEALQMCSDLCDSHRHTAADVGAEHLGKDIADFIYEHRGPPPYLWHRLDGSEAIKQWVATRAEKAKREASGVR